MIYCYKCATVMMERTLFDNKILLCPMCGDIYEQIQDAQYRYVGTTNGNRQLRELLPITDEGDTNK